MTIKKCTKCKIKKRIDLFYKNSVSGYKDGYDTRCKCCIKKYRKEYYAKNIEEITRKSKAYDRTEPRKKARNKSLADYRKKYPGKYRAGYVFQSHLKNGRIKKFPCINCGESNEVQGHHHDYRKPLDVIWLCRQCHLKEHNKQVRLAE